MVADYRDPPPIPHCAKASAAAREAKPYVVHRLGLVSAWADIRTLADGQLQILWTQDQRQASFLRRDLAQAAAALLARVTINPDKIIIEEAQ